MTKLFHKRIMIFGIKYLPAVFAIGISLKILLLNLQPGETMSYTGIVHWINIFLCIFGISITYSAGKSLHFCWKHRSLCRTAFNGCIGYGIIILFDIQSHLITWLCIIYVMLVLILTVTYNELK